MVIGLGIISNKIVFKALFVSLFLISGCLPITPDEKVNILEVNADKSIKQIEITRGPLTAQADKFEGDCTEEYIEMFEHYHCQLKDETTKPLLIDKLPQLSATTATTTTTNEFDRCFA